jgi:hypothetical protein
MTKAVQISAIGGSQVMTIVETFRLANLAQAGHWRVIMPLALTTLMFIFEAKSTLLSLCQPHLAWRGPGWSRP